MKYLLSADDTPGTILRVRDIVVKKTKQSKASAVVKVTLKRKGETDNKQNKQVNSAHTSKFW